MTLLQSVARYCRQHRLLAGGDRLVVGVSGGADSLCLLALLRDLASPLDLHLHVAHLNHSLRGADADADADFVAGLAQQWQIPVTIGKSDVAALARQNRLSLEEAARQARYTFLAQVAKLVNASKVAVAHHLNDQAETVLLRLLRGTGVTGLRGMRPLTPLTDYLPPAMATGKANLLLIRPLLATPRADIEAFCRARNLTPRDDPSNRDPAFLRNRIRAELLPLLATYNPNILRTLARTADLMAADHDLLQIEVERAWRFVVRSQNAEAVTVDLHDWRTLPLATRRAIVRRAVEALRGSARHLEFTHVDRALQLLQSGRVGAQMDFPHHLRLTLGYDTFTLADRDYRPSPPNLPSLPEKAKIPVQIPGITRLPGSRWYVHTELYLRESLSDAAFKQRDPWHAYFDAEVVGRQPFFRTRRPGDTFCPFGLGGHHQRLSDFMIDHKIPAAYRNAIPLFVSEGGRICWVCGWRTDHHSRVTAATRQVLSVRFKQKV